MKFCKYWMLEDPFAADVKSIRTHYHEIMDSPYPNSRSLWVKDDWRTMVVILRADIEMWEKHWKDIDFG